MPTTKKRPSTTAAVPKTAIAQAGQMLQDLPEKPKDTWSLREAVYLLHEPITTALDRGYSHEEVSSILGEKGVEITASSLKRYLASAKREKGITKTKGKRTRKPRGSASKTIESSETLADAAAALENASPASEAAPEPSEPTTLSRKRRTKTTSSRAKASTTKASTTKTAAKTRSTSRSKTTSRASTRGRKQSDNSQ